MVIRCYSGNANNEIFRSGKIKSSELAQIKADHQLWLKSNFSRGMDGRLLLNEKTLRVRIAISLCSPLQKWPIYPIGSLLLSPPVDSLLPPLYG